MTSKFMQKTAVASLLCAAAVSALATEYGTVVSVIPVVGAVPVQQRQCTEEQVSYQQPNSGAGALIGAIAGAAIGSNMGSGAGRAAATGLGMVAGSVIGDRAEANGNPPATSLVQRCRVIVRYENRNIGYDVAYDYQGVRRVARLAQDPGDRIALETNVTASGAMPQGRMAAPPPVDSYYEQQPPTVYREAPPPAVVYVQPPVYYGPPAYMNPWPYVGGAIYLGHGGRRHRW